jgi:hypothetical protein
MKQTEPVTFTPDSLREITALHDAAVQEGRESFMYRGRQYSVRYTVYLIDMLRQQWGMKGRGREAA